MSKTMTCPVCQKTISVVGTFAHRARVHGPAGNRCAGGGIFGAHTPEHMTRLDEARMAQGEAPVVAAVVPAAPVGDTSLYGASYLAWCEKYPS